MYRRDLIRTHGGLLSRADTLGQHISVLREAVSTQTEATAPSLVREVVNSPGRPRDVGTRAFMEPRFGHDFSRVRVHADAKSAAGEVDPESGRAFDQLEPIGVAGVEAGTAGASEEAPVEESVPAAAPAPASGSAAPAPVAPPTVALPSHVRAASSPTGMADRIPPRVDTSVTVGVSAFPKGGTPVKVSVEGSGGGNGTVTINGAATVNLYGEQ